MIDRSSLVYVHDPRKPNAWRLIHPTLQPPRTWAMFRRNMKRKRIDRQKAKQYSY
jgi:hypothetical protein